MDPGPPPAAQTQPQLQPAFQASAVPGATAAATQASAAAPAAVQDHSVRGGFEQLRFHAFTRLNPVVQRFAQQFMGQMTALRNEANVNEQLAMQGQPRPPIRRRGWNKLRLFTMKRAAPMIVRLAKRSQRETNTVGARYMARNEPAFGVG
jgi:hypothetical protein